MSSNTESRKLKMEPFSERCKVEGYRESDPDSKCDRSYFWNSEYGLLAVIEGDGEHSVLFKVKKELPNNIEDLITTISEPNFVLGGGCSSEMFDTKEKLEDFLNGYMALLTGQTQ